MKYSPDTPRTKSTNKQTNKKLNKTNQTKQKSGKNNNDFLYAVSYKPTTLVFC